jgi:hypothetical protein
VLASGYSGSGRIPLRHSNNWYQSRRSEKPGKTSPGSHGDGEPVKPPEGHTDGCDWRVGLGAWITSARDHTDGCDGRVGPNVCRGRLLGLVPHLKLMVGECHIKVGAVLTHQASLLG